MKSMVTELDRKMLCWRFEDGERSYFLISQTILEDEKVFFHGRSSKEIIEAPLSGEGKASHCDEHGNISLIEASTITIGSASYLKKVEVEVLEFAISK